jgi:M6 family metalloprotease-like protein
MKKNLLLVVFLLVAFSNLVNAAYFSFQPFRVIQPDGTPIECFVSGDEYFNWLHDKDGYTIIQASDGYFYYGVTSGETVVPTSFLVNKAEPASVGLMKWARISLKEYNNRKEFYATGYDKSVKAPHLGTMNNIAIYIRFQDDPEFSVARQIFDDKFNLSPGTSLKSYYSEASYNKFNITTTHYPECQMTTNLSYQDSHERGYFQPYNATTNTQGYTNGDQRTIREHTLLRDAINWVNVNSPVPSGLNIDGDNDGRVDNVCFIIEGGNDAWAELLWAHRWVLYSFDVFINGKQVFDYTFQPQTQVDVYTLCHEMFHALGAPDLYHYSYDGFVPAGDWDLMESGSGHMGAYMKWKYADASWITDMPYIFKSGKYWLKPLASPGNNCYQILSPYSSGEFFVVEYRKKAGAFETNIPGSGLLVYRIDQSETGNAGGPPDEVYIYRPNGTKTTNGNISIACFSAESGRTAINDATNPSSFLQDGSAGGLNISHVTSAGDSISFVVSLSTIKDPAAFAATAMSTSQNNLVWQKNTSGDRVMIAYSLTPEFGFPDDGADYSAGSVLEGGGTVIYVGEDNSFDHSGLTTNTTYYYTAWSVTGGNQYSPGIMSSATTFCEAIKGLPFTEDFEENSGYLDCWTQQNSNPAWVFITGNGTGAGHGFPASAYSGTRNALLKDMNSAGNPNMLLSPILDLSAYSGVQLKFWLYMRSWVGKQDELKIYYRNDPDESWILLQEYTSSVSDWTEEILPLTMVSAKFQLGFEGNAKYGFGVCLDDVEITGISMYTLEVTPSSQNVDPAAGSFGFTVNSNTAWTAASDAPWCSVTQGGTGAGEITAAYEENFSSDSRSAVITVDADGLPSKSVTLIQRGRGVSVQEVSAREINIFPNPSEGVIWINAAGFDNKNLDVNILGLTGREILSSTIIGGDEKRFDLSKYPKGFYFVKVETVDYSTVRRLILTK